MTKRGSITREELRGTFSGEVIRGVPGKTLLGSSNEDAATVDPLVEWERKKKEMKSRRNTNSQQQRAMMMPHPPQGQVSPITTSNHFMSQEQNGAEHNMQRSDDSIISLSRSKSTVGLVAGSGPFGGGGGGDHYGATGANSNLMSVANSPKQRLSTLSTVLQSRQTSVAHKRNKEIRRVEEASNLAQANESFNLSIRSGFYKGGGGGPKTARAESSGTSGGKKRTPSPPKRKKTGADLEGFSLLDNTIEAVVQRMGTQDPTSSLKDRFERVAHHVGAYFAHDDLLHSFNAFSDAEQQESSSSGGGSLQATLTTLGMLVNTLHQHHRLAHKDNKHGGQFQAKVQRFTSDLFRHLLDVKVGFKPEGLVEAEEAAANRVGGGPSGMASSSSTSFAHHSAGGGGGEEFGSGLLSINSMSGGAVGGGTNDTNNSHLPASAAAGWVHPMKKSGAVRSGGTTTTPSNKMTKLLGGPNVRLGNIPFNSFVEMLLSARVSLDEQLEGEEEEEEEEDGNDGEQQLNTPQIFTKIKKIIDQHTQDVPRCLYSLYEYKQRNSELKLKLADTSEQLEHELKAHDQIVTYWKRYTLKRVFKGWRTTVVNQRNDRKTAEIRSLREKNAVQLQEILEEKIRKIDNLEGRLAALRFQSNQDRHEFQAVLDKEKEAQRKIRNDLKKLQTESESYEKNLLQLQAKLKVVTSELERTQEARREDRHIHEQQLISAREGAITTRTKKKRVAKRRGSAAADGTTSLVNSPRSEALSRMGSPALGAFSAKSRSLQPPPSDSIGSEYLDGGLEDGGEDDLSQMLEQLQELFEDLCDCIAPTIPCSTLATQNAATLWIRVYDAAVAATATSSEGSPKKSSSSSSSVDFAELCRQERLGKFTYDPTPLKRKDPRCKINFPQYEAGTIPDLAELFLASSVAFCAVPPNPTVCIKRPEHPKVAVLRERAVDAWERARQMDMIRLRTGFDLLGEALLNGGGGGPPSTSESINNSSFAIFAKSGRRPTSAAAASGMNPPLSPQKTSSTAVTTKRGGERDEGPPVEVDSTSEFTRRTSSFLANLMS